ncbi:hypothetical protein LZP85_06905 [Priestia flexa]|uniref:hypothetical protein n=1 Tax=Priestia flexa TaxID=86664 RepID=UPI001F15E54A|nr:hypothetical protein [Priestia flexa]UIR31507.1 hypothetical protein LZP85_06905 [Priestia flexa]
MFKDELFLSPKYTLEGYKELLTNLTVNSNNSDWHTAIEIFRDRIDGRFLRVTKKLLKECEGDESLSTAFSIMALNCLLIETLQQFYTGSDATSRPNEEAFVNFLMNSPYFNESTKKYQKVYKRNLVMDLIKSMQRNFIKM